MHTPRERARTVRYAVSLAEFLLGRPLRSVLDVGCGQGEWHGLVRAIRPRARYVGVDPSEYAVRRFGRRRHLLRGGVEDLPALRLGGPFDLVVCAGVLNYLPRPVLGRGLGHIASLLGGVAFLEIFAREDEIEGCTQGFDRQSRAAYRRLLRRHGLTPCGPHAYVGRALRGSLAALEKC
ncbi:MAG TPA: class I SAM-dependent methyltransferase [Vicinamibacteria bacterium]